MSETVMTPEFRVSFPAVFIPKKNDLNGKMEYSVVALFKKGENLDKLKAAAEAACKEKWGEDKAKWPKKLKSPFRDQGEKDSAGYEDGAVFVTLKSNQKPGLVDAKLQDIIDDTEFYAGCWARATVRAFAWEGKSPDGKTTVSWGVSLGLQNLQKTRDGEPLGYRAPAAASEFEAVASEGGDAGGLFD